MSMLDATPDPFICEVHEHEVGQSIHNLRAVVGGIVVLSQGLGPVQRAFGNFKRTSSHQLMVDVTGCQNPG